MMRIEDGGAAGLPEQGHAATPYPEAGALVGLLDSFPATLQKWRTNVALLVCGEF